MLSNTESYPFTEEPGKEIGHGFESIVKEFGPDWVVKEFNPVKPDGTAKDERAYGWKQSKTNIKELQETQKILSQDIIYGDKLIPTYWVLGSDVDGKEKYFTVQKRFQGETLQNIIRNGDESVSYSERFINYFKENIELRSQMMDLVWGSKRALVEMKVFDDFHADNIAVTVENNGEKKLKIFDIQNMLLTQNLLYNDPYCSLETKKRILYNTEKHASRLEKYERWLGVTEEERNRLDAKYGIDQNKYQEEVNNLQEMHKNLFPDYLNGEKDIASELLTEISAIYPFLNQEEYNSYMEKASKINPESPVLEVEALIRLLDNPHATVRRISYDKFSGDSEGELEKKPSSELIDNVLYLNLPSMGSLQVEDLEKVFNPFKNISEGLVIDLRENGGGNEMAPREFAEKYLIKKGAHRVGTNVIIAPEGGLHNARVWTDSENKTPYDKPIVILISVKTFSAAERFTSLMKAGTDCVLIGTETGGGSAGAIKEIIGYKGNNFLVTIPTWRYFLEGENKPIEETKIKPDILYEKEDIIDFATKYIKNLSGTEKS